MDTKLKSASPQPNWFSHLFHLNSLVHAIAVLVTTILFVFTSLAAEAAETSDPLESINRVTLNANRAVDSMLIKPVARLYQKIIPAPVKSGIRNFFGNLGSLTSAANNVLQLRLDRAAVDLGRFAVNTTVGIGGVIEVAEPVLGLRSQRQDFGMTLAAWGVDSGPYLVLPLIGSSTVRDVVGLGIDRLANPVTKSGETSLRDPLLVTRSVDLRAAYLPLDELISGDEYLFIRELYMQDRYYKTHGETMEVAFGNFQ